MQTQMGVSLSEQRNVRITKLERLQQEGFNPFDVTTFDVTVRLGDIKANYSQYEDTEVHVAGRLISKRGMGKASFANIQDSGENIQIHARKDEMDADSYKRFTKYDLGDIIGIYGTVFKTGTGEITIRAKEITLLSKALRPMPEKRHGLQDTELRFRNRHLDLLCNSDSRKVFETRAKFMRFMRNYLDNREFTEVETPVLQVSAGGAAARPFITHHNALNINMYLRIATELHLKRLVIGGMNRVYEIGRIFRNEGMDHRHNPEFTSIELYQAYTDVYGMMEIAQDIIAGAVWELCGTYNIEWLGKTIDMRPDWNRLTMVEAVNDYTGVDFREISTTEEVVKIAEEHGILLNPASTPTWGNVLYAFFEQKVEGHLIQPTFILEYPVEVSPLTKRCVHDRRLTERFELFVCGCEIANAYSELNDPIEQRKRFEKQVELRERGDEEAELLDENFIEAMEYGMPPTGGMGIGIDRVIMLLTNSDSVRDVILFPTMRPQ